MCARLGASGIDGGKRWKLCDVTTARKLGTGTGAEGGVAKQWEGQVARLGDRGRQAPRDAS